MAEVDDKPLPNLDPPNAMEPLLRRIAEGIDRMEKKQPPVVPSSMSGGESPTMPTSHRQADQSPPNLNPQQFANAGNIQIDPQRGQQQPSVFGRAAISLQSMTNMMADYGMRTPPAVHAMTSYSKVASLMSGDVHTRGESLASIGKRPSTGGDESQMLRSLELGSRGGRGQNLGDSGDASPQIARNDLKDSIDSLKEAIDSLKEVVKDIGVKGPEPKGSTILRGTPPNTPQASGARSRPVTISLNMPSGNPNASFGLGAGS